MSGFVPRAYHRLLANVGTKLVSFPSLDSVTSTTSAQLIAVSSIISTDIYHTYWRPDATDAQVIRVSHLSVIGFALFMSGFSVMLYYVGISLGWTLYFLGIITCPGMVTLCLTILWRKQSWAGAVIGPIVGLVAGIAIWLSTAQSYGDGQLDVTTTGALLPCLWGTIAAAFLPPLISVVLTLVKPQDFDWERFNDIKLISDKADDESYTAAHENTPAEITYMKSRSKIAGWTGLFLL